MGFELLPNLGPGWVLIHLLLLEVGGDGVTGRLESPHFTGFCVIGEGIRGNSGDKREPTSFSFSETNLSYPIADEWDVMIWDAGLVNILLNFLGDRCSGSGVVFSFSFLKGFALLVSVAKNSLDVLLSGLLELDMLYCSTRSDGSACSLGLGLKNQLFCSVVCGITFRRLPAHSYIEPL